MKKLLLFLLPVLLKAQYQAPEWEWDAVVNWTVQGSGGPYLKIFNDKLSNLYTVENFCTLKKYDPNKDLLWAKCFENGFVNKVISSTNEAVIVCGAFYGVLKIDNDSLISHGDLDLFLVKLNNLGEVQWLTQIGSKNPDGGGDIVLNEENIFMTGGLGDSTYINNTLIPKYPGRDIFLAKFNLEGNLTDIKFSKTGNPENDCSTGVEIQAGRNGKIYVLVHIHGQSTYQNSVFIETYGDLIWRLDSDLNLEWSKEIGMYYYGRDFDLTIDSEGNMIYARNSYYNHEGPGGSIIKLSPSGETMWSENIRPNNAVMGVDVDNADNVYYTGWRARKGAVPPSTEFGIVKQYMFTGVKRPNGEVSWLREDSARSIFPIDIKILSDNEVIVAGNFSDTLILKDTLLSMGNSYLASLKIPVMSTEIRNFNVLNPISLSPNPSSGKFNLSGLPQNSELKIYNVCGTCIYSDKITLDSIKVDISGNSPGIYFLEAKSKEGIVRKKLVIE